MGGGPTEVSETTRTVFLEAAHFDPGVVRRAAKALSLSTEASFRFERFVDPTLVPIALERACELLTQYAGGEVVDGNIDEYPTPIEPRVIPLRAARVNAILGLGLTPETITDALRRLGLSVVPNGSDFDVTVPTFRPDLTLEIDLIEEVGRMIGYENLPETLPKSPSVGAGDNQRGIFDSAIRQILIGQGLTETYSHTLSAPSPFDDPAFESERVSIRLSLSAELSVLRRSLLPHLLDALALNLRHRQTTLRLFEVGRVFKQPAPHDYREPRRVAAIVTGEGLDFFAAKGVVENLLTALHLDQVAFKSSTRHAMHPFRCADVFVNDEAIGFVAEVDPGEIARSLDVPQATGRIACFELDGDALRSLSESAQARRYKPLPKYPSVARDLALLFDDATPYGGIEAVIHGASGGILESVTLQSIYIGTGVPEGKKSVAVRLTLRSQERTLTDADAEAALASARAALEEAFGATAR
jgi:phenylalanyl-tRNA synthetase beta chain